MSWIPGTPLPTATLIVLAYSLAEDVAQSLTTGGDRDRERVRQPQWREAIGQVGKELRSRKDLPVETVLAVDKLTEAWNRLKQVQG